jgi:hypothetical protein
VTATVELVCLRVTVTLGRVVVVALGSFFLVADGRWVVTVVATVPDGRGTLVGAIVVVVAVVVPVVGILAASEAPRSSVPWVVVVTAACAASTPPAVNAAAPTAT